MNINVLPQRPRIIASHPPSRLPYHRSQPWQLDTGHLLQPLLPPL